MSVVYLKNTDNAETAIPVLNLAITRNQGQISQLSFDFISDDLGYVGQSMMVPFTTITVPETGEMFRMQSNSITAVDQKHTYNVTALAVATELHDVFITDRLTKSQTLDACMKFLTKGTAFKYVIHDKFDDHTYSRTYTEGFGNGFADDLFMNQLVSDFKFEWWFDNYTIHLAKKQGSSDAFAFIDGLNTNGIQATEDYSNIQTHIKGFGKPRGEEELQKKWDTRKKQNDAKYKNQRQALADKYKAEDKSAKDKYEADKKSKAEKLAAEKKAEKERKDAENEAVKKEATAIKAANKGKKLTSAQKAAQRKKAAADKKARLDKAAAIKAAQKKAHAEQNASDVAKRKSEREQKVARRKAERSALSKNIKEDKQAEKRLEAQEKQQLIESPTKYYATAEYTSPAAKIWHINKDAEAVYDERFTDSGELLKYIKGKIQDYPMVQYTVNQIFFNDKAVVKNKIQVGNSGWLRDRYGINVDVRIIGTVEHPQNPEIADAVTFGNFMYDFTKDQLRQREATKKNAKLESNRPNKDINELRDAVYSGIWFDSD